MMPNQGRPAAPSLPPVDKDATAPFSELFNSGFDRATVDATAQLADRSIFVTSSGRRFRLESIPDPDPGPSPITSASVPPAPDQPRPDSVPGGRRSSSIDAGSHAYSPGRYSVRTGQSGGSAPGAEPDGPTQEATYRMSRLSIGRFSATPLYRESDGGVQAAETLTDPYLAPRSPLSSSSPTSPKLSCPQPEQPASRAPHGDLGGSGVTPPAGWSNIDYANYTAQANVHVQASRQMAATPSGRLPSLMEGSHPIPPSPQEPAHRAASSPSSYDPPLASAPPYTLPPPPSRASDPAISALASPSSSSSLPPQRASDPFAARWAVSSEKEFFHVGGRGGQIAENGTAAYQYYDHHPHPAPAVGRRATYAMGNDIDTLTPVVVYGPPSTTTSSDGASTGRDNVLPGEDLLFDGLVRSAQTLTAAAVFREGVLKVFRNTITNDLRFHCRVERESETYWMKASNAELVPAYAYDQRLSHVVYIRDRESDKGTGYMQASQGSSRPSGIYQFSSLKELFDFQARLTGEKVVLDIGSVRMVTLSRAGSRASTAYSGGRLQIWHEDAGADGSGGGSGSGRRARKSQSEAASFVTAGTALSGPLRERTVASASRLVVFLGRLGEYITAYITDDLEVVPDGQTLVKLRPRKSPIPFSKKGSRFAWVKAHQEPSHGSEPAGLDISGKAVEADVDDYDSYKTFEIEFENSPSQDNFLRKWDEVIKERRLQRMKLAQIEDDMKRAVFTGRQARVIKT